METEISASRIVIDLRFCRTGVPKNFAKLKEKHLCQSLFFNIKLEDSARDFIKKEPLTQVFRCEKFAKVCALLNYEHRNKEPINK